MASLFSRSDRTTRPREVAAVVRSRRAFLKYIQGSFGARAVGARSLSVTFLAVYVSPALSPRPVLSQRTRQILQKRRHRVGKTEKKRRARHRIGYLLPLLWCAKTGGERESNEKKERKRTISVFFWCLGLTFQPERPNHEALGGRSRRKIAPRLF